MEQHIELDLNNLYLASNKDSSLLMDQFYCILENRNFEYSVKSKLNFIKITITDAFSEERASYFKKLIKICVYLLQIGKLHQISVYLDYTDFLKENFIETIDLIKFADVLTKFNFYIKVNNLDTFNSIIDNMVNLSNKYLDLHIFADFDLNKDLTNQIINYFPEIVNKIHSNEVKICLENINNVFYDRLNVKDILPERKSVFKLFNYIIQSQTFDKFVFNSKVTFNEIYRINKALQIEYSVYNDNYNKIDGNEVVDYCDSNKKLIEDYMKTMTKL